MSRKLTPTNFVQADSIRIAYHIKVGITILLGRAESDGEVGIILDLHEAITTLAMFAQAIKEYADLREAEAKTAILKANLSDLPPAGQS